MFFNPREVQQCTLISIKTGGCTEDCKYCSQVSEAVVPSIITGSISEHPYIRIFKLSMRVVTEGLLWLWQSNFT